MINHGTVESAKRPEAITMDDYSVWVASNIEEVEKPAENQKFYQYTLIQYTKDEYIQTLPTQAQLESTQEALDFLLLNAGV